VAAGALVAACDVPLPTELGDAIDEAIDVQARKARDGTPTDRTRGSHDTYLAKWFLSDPAPLVFVDDVRIGRYEDLPESVRIWSESGLRTDGLVDRVEVINGARSRELFGKEGANGAIRIFTKDRSAGIVETVAESPAESDRDNLWGAKFSGMAGSRPFPLVYIDGVRVVVRGDAFATDVRLAPSWPDAMPWPDPKDIDRIEVIKGAAAAMLHGNEAAGGVILIFLKK